MTDLALESATKDRRHSNRRRVERRGSGPLTILIGALRGRRRTPRRGDDGYGHPIGKQGHYVDWYDQGILLLALSVLLLSCTDAFFTLNLIQHGAVEANGFMAKLMDVDVQLFVNVKLALTGISLVVLVGHSHFHLWRVITVRHLLQGAVLGYSALIFYEVILLNYVVLV